MDFWIEKASNRVVKVDGRVDFSVKVNKEASPMITENIRDGSYKVNWKEDLGYSSKEVIKLPIGATTAGTIDAAKAIDEVFGDAAKANTKDAKMTASAKELQIALELYHTKSQTFPAVSSMEQLLTELKKSGALPVSVLTSTYSGIGYRYSGTGTGYALKFKLNNQEQTGSGIVGEAPNKYFTITVSGQPDEPELAKTGVETEAEDEDTSSI